MRYAFAVFALFPGFVGFAPGQAHAGDENPIFFETRSADESRSADAAGARTAAIAALTRKVGDRGHLRVMVELKMSGAAVAALSSERPSATSALKHVQTDVIKRVLGRATDTAIRRFQYGPFVAMSVDSPALKRLIADRDVVSIQEDAPLFADRLLYNIARIKAPEVWSAGVRGAGYTVAVLDSGFQTNHPMLVGKTVSEACYSRADAGNTASLCPDGAQSSTAANSSTYCANDECRHGTHVAGIAVGREMALAQGVATSSKLIAIQVFHNGLKAAECGKEPVPCLKSSYVDVEAGLERVYALRNKYKIAALNMSLGGGRYTGTCDDRLPAIAHIMKLLTAAGIANVVASGNESFNGALSAPACISSAIAVGSTSQDDAVSFFSNHSSLLALMAPGENIQNALPGSKYGVLNGTSMAAPHVAGAFAMLKQVAPYATVPRILKILEATGKPVARDGITKRRIDLLGAFNALTSVQADAAVR